MEKDLYQLLSELLRSDPKLSNLFEKLKGEVNSKPYTKDESIKQISTLYSTYFSKRNQAKKISENYSDKDSSNNSPKITLEEIYEFIYALFSSQDLQITSVMASRLGSLQDLLKRLDDGQKQLKNIQSVYDEARAEKDVQINNYYKQRKEVADRNLKIVDEDLEIKQNELNALNKSINTAKQTLKTENDLLSGVRRTRTEEERKTRNAITNYETVTQQLETVKGELVTAEDKLATVTSDLQISKYDLKNNEAELETAKANLTITQAELETEKSKLLAETEKYNKLVEAATNLRDIELPALKEKLKTETIRINAEINSLEEKVKELEQSIETYKNKEEEFKLLLNKLSLDKKNLDTTIEKASSALSEKEKQLEEIKSLIFNTENVGKMISAFTGITETKQAIDTIKDSVEGASSAIESQLKDTVESLSAIQTSVGSNLTESLEANNEKLLHGMGEMLPTVAFDKFSTVVEVIEADSERLSDAIDRILAETEKLVRTTNKYDLNQSGFRRMKRTINDMQTQLNTSRVLEEGLRVENSRLKSGLYSLTTIGNKVDRIIDIHDKSLNDFVNNFASIGLDPQVLRHKFNEVDGNAIKLMNFIRFATNFDDQYKSYIAEYFNPFIHTSVYMPNGDNYILLERYDIDAEFSELQKEVGYDSDDWLIKSNRIMGNISELEVNEKLWKELEPERYSNFIEEVRLSNPKAVEAYLKSNVSDSNKIIIENAVALSNGSTEIPFYVASLMTVILDDSITETSNPAIYLSPSIVTLGVNLRSSVNMNSIPEELNSLMNKFNSLDTQYMFDVASKIGIGSDLEPDQYTLDIPSWNTSLQSIRYITLTIVFDGTTPFMQEVNTELDSKIREETIRIDSADGSFKPFLDVAIPSPASVVFFKGDIK